MTETKKQTVCEKCYNDIVMDFKGELIGYDMFHLFAVIVLVLLAYGLRRSLILTDTRGTVIIGFSFIICLAIDYYFAKQKSKLLLKYYVINRKVIIDEMREREERH